MTRMYAGSSAATESARGYIPGVSETAERRITRIIRSAGANTHLVFLPPLLPTIGEIVGLLKWPEEWDGYQMAPSHSAVVHALSWIRDMHDDALAADREWISPSVVADAHGNVVFEWWKDQKKLTVYVSPTTSEYIKVWGPDIFSNIEDDKAEVSEERQALWRWLTD